MRGLVAVLMVMAAFASYAHAQLPTTNRPVPTTDQSDSAGCMMGRVMLQAMDPGWPNTNEGIWVGNSRSNGDVVGRNEDTASFESNGTQQGTVYWKDYKGYVQRGYAGGVPSGTLAGSKFIITDLWSATGRHVQPDGGIAVNLYPISCPVETTSVIVVFQPFGKVKGPSLQKAMHAVIVLQGQYRGQTYTKSYEANYSGSDPWPYGYLICGVRNLTTNPIPPDAKIVAAAHESGDIAKYIDTMDRLCEETNNFHIKYWFVPEAFQGTANSNTFVYSVLKYMGIVPPPEPPPTETGWGPGYFDGIKFY